MKKLVMMAVLALVQTAFAHELSDEQLNIKKVVANAGAPPQCTSCQSDATPMAFTKINPDDGGSCLKAVSRPGYIEQRVCASSAQNAGDFLYYDFISVPGNQLVGNNPNQYRAIQVHSTEGSLNGTYLTLQDVDRSVGASQQMGSDVFLLPRKTIPQAQTIGNEIHLLLQTGEEVVIDKNTKAIISGALSEGAPSFGSSTKPANISYTGSGISIQMDLRTYDDPRKKAISAKITQAGKTCSVPRAKLFNGEGVPLSSSDADFLSAINRACPGKGFSL